MTGLCYNRKMISIYMIITALVTTALAKVSTECNLSGPKRDQKCFGALGEPLFFHLPTNVSKLILIKSGSTVFDKNDMTVFKSNYNDSEYFTNGMLKMDNVRKTDAGDYKLETFGTDGTLLNTIKVHLEIQAPVSEPAVSQMCLSPEQMNVSCSSEGDEVKFILTLDGLLLLQTIRQSHSANTRSLAGRTDEQLKPSVSNVAISLHGQLTGTFLCHVRNNVSTEETVIDLTSCKGSTSYFSLVTVAVIASVATLILALFVGIKYLKKNTRPMTVNEDNAEDEIIYSDVRVMKHR